MDNRFQFLLLTARVLGLAASLACAPVVLAEDTNGSMDISDINNEVIEFGLFTGILNVEDFTSELLSLPGVGITFRASEDFFIQFNYLETDISLSSYENNQGQLFSGDDRTFTHYDLLIGYNLFQGEVFRSSTNAKLSTLYAVAGVGDTEFGGESSFTYTFGLGYEVALTRHIGVTIDFRDYIYQSTLVSEDKRMVNATQFSVGAKYSF